MLGFIDKMVNI